MKTILMSLFLAAAPPCFSASVAWACDRDGEAIKRILVIPDAKKIAGDQHKVVVATAGEGALAYAFAVGDAGDDGRSEGKTVWVSTDKTAGKVKTKVKAKVRSKGKGKQGAWLGVSIARVPKALATQFDLEDEGVIVVNMVSESPADRAGFELHDVILSIGDDAVEGKVGKAIDLIKSHKPGDEVDVIVLRGGDKKPITVKLGSRAELKADKLELKFEGGPLAEVEERIKTRGKMLRRGKHGEWIVEDLGDLKELKNLPKSIKMFLPKSGSRSTQVHITGEKKVVTTKVMRDGSTIMITGQSDGPITVTRTDRNGDKTTTTYETYDDEDELREADKEAYELWNEAGESAVVYLNLDAIEIPDIDIEIPDIDIKIPGIDIEIPDIEIPDIDIEVPEFTFEFDTDEWKEHTEEWKSHLEESLGEAKESYERAMEEFKEVMEQWRGGEGFPKDFKFKHWPPMAWPKDGRSELPWLLREGHPSKPKHTFEVDAAGTIEVRIRKGDSELVQIYEDEDDLARRSPKLYKKYIKLMGL